MERLAGRVILLWGWQRWLAALLAGAVTSLALAPFDFFAACFLGFPVLVWLLDGAVGTGGRLARLLPAFVTGWWFGFGYFLAGMWWLGAGMDLPFGWVRPLAALGPPALLALFYGLAAFAARLMWSDGFGRIAALAFAFGLAEWMRAALLSGFAWNAIGYAAMPVPVLMQAVRPLGIFGVSALAVFVFCAPALLAATRVLRTGLALAGLLAAAFIGYGYAQLSTATSPRDLLRVRIVQPGSTAADFAGYIELSTAPAEGRPPELILWPELAIPSVLADRPDLLEALGEALEEGQVLVAGTVRDEGGGGARRLYNAAVAVNGNGAIIDAADKVRFLPFLDASPFAPILGGTAGGYSPGSTTRLLPVSGGARAVPLVDGEAVVPGIAADQAAGADLIVSLAGSAFYGGMQAPYQFLRQLQIRAVEARLPAAGAVPGGPSAAIGADGRIIDGLAAGARGVLDADLPAAGADFFDIKVSGAVGLTIVIFFGILALFESIRGRLN